jgi:hypothetical protein
VTFFRSVVVVYHDHGGKADVSRREIEMTLQVALVGTDGIVLATDLKLSRVYGNQYETSLTDKFRVNHERGLAVMWSGDFFPSRDLAMKALEMTDEQLEFPDHLLEETARQVFTEARRTIGLPMVDGEVILVSTKDLATIHHITVKGESFSDVRIFDKAISGHHANSACSYVQLFYEKRPVPELIPLVAHTILSAGRINPAGIGGLKILCCEATGITEISKARLEELEKWSEALHNSTRKNLQQKKAFRQ